jgi:hypothetical protein
MMISHIDYSYACTWSHYIVACWERFSAGLADQHEMLSGVFQRFLHLRGILVVRHANYATHYTLISGKTEISNLFDFVTRRISVFRWNSRHGAQDSTCLNRSASCVADGRLLSSTSTLARSLHAC